MAASPSRGCRSTATIGSRPHRTAIITAGFAINPQSANIVYAATDGGLYRSWLYGSRNTWSFVSEGVTNAGHDLALSNPGPVIITGTQDSGTVRFMGSPVWQHIYPGPPYGKTAAWWRWTRRTWTRSTP